MSLQLKERYVHGVYNLFIYQKSNGVLQRYYSIRLSSNWPYSKPTALITLTYYVSCQWLNAMKAVSKGEAMQAAEGRAIPNW